MRWSIEFWSSSTKETYEAAFRHLTMDCGWHEEVAQSWLEDLYHATAREFGG